MPVAQEEKALSEGEWQEVAVSDCQDCGTGDVVRYSAIAEIPPA